LDIAEIHLTARREAMPHLHRTHSDDETRNYFGRVVGDRPSARWVARIGGEIVGYMLIDGEDLGHLYVRPGWQRRGVGLLLLTKAKEAAALSRTYSAFALRLSRPEVCVFCAPQRIVPVITSS
jgi:ribosomal protein S18 acetylase RimI-like enzyme